MTTPHFLGPLRRNPGYCLAAPGREMACFLPEGGMAGFDLWGQPGQYRVEWFEPATGKAYDGGAVSGDTRHALGAPAGEGASFDSGRRLRSAKRGS